MRYRLMLRSDLEEERAELVLTQKLINFNPRLPAVIFINAVLIEGTLLSKAVLSDEVEIEFENKRILKIGDLTLEEALEFNKAFWIDFNFLSADAVNFNILNAVVIE